MRPDLGFVIQQGSQIDGREVPEVENLHGAPAARLGQTARHEGREPSSLVLRGVGGKLGENRSLTREVQEIESLGNFAIG